MFAWTAQAVSWWTVKRLVQGNTPCVTGRENSTKGYRGDHFRYSSNRTWFSHSLTKKYIYMDKKRAIVISESLIHATLSNACTSVSEITLYLMQNFARSGFFSDQFFARPHQCRYYGGGRLTPSLLSLPHTHTAPGEWDDERSCTFVCSCLSEWREWQCRDT